MKIFGFIKKILINKILLLIGLIYLAYSIILFSFPFINVILYSFASVLGALLIGLIHNVRKKTLLAKQDIVKICTFYALFCFTYLIVFREWESGFKVSILFVRGLISLYYHFFLTYMGLDFGNKITKSLQLKENNNGK